MIHKVYHLLVESPQLKLPVKYDVVPKELSHHQARKEPVMLKCTEASLSEEELECLRGCSQYAQYYHTRKAFDEGRCPFCSHDLENKILYNKNGWIASEVPQNFTTRKSTLALQLLLLPKRHVRNPWELDAHEQQGYFKVLNWARTKFDMQGGGIITRFGDMRYNVGTVMHLHTTIMVPSRNGSVSVPLQKNEATRSENELQMRIFSRKYDSGAGPETEM